MQDGVNGDYVTRVFDDMQAIAPEVWDALLARQGQPTPFMRHAYLQAMTASGSAVPDTGWGLRLFTLWQGDDLAAACPVWLKSHSRGEYVFDWAWADAYRRHGLRYYPKLLGAVPFTPVPGTRLLARHHQAAGPGTPAIRQLLQLGPGSVIELDVVRFCVDRQPDCARRGMAR